MSGDPAFVGVRQPTFDAMVGRHTRAAAQIDQLAQALWAELNRVQLDTSPAIRLRAMAGRLRAQATDLQRRQRLVHEMERQKIDFTFRAGGGTFWELPDRLGAIQARVDGAEAADLAGKAAAGDRTALSRLMAFAAEAGDPHFAKALLQGLGPDGIITLPAALAQRLRRDMDGRDPSLGTDEAGVQSALRLLSKALAVGTDPSGEGYLGDAYLDRLKAQGRAEHRLPADTYAGYQSLATLLDLSEGHPPFSARFMRVVGSDMIAYDREHRPSHPPPSTPPPFAPPYVPGLPRARPEDGSAPIPDLTGLLHLGWALTPAGDRATAEPPARGRTDFLNGLLHAAGLSKASAQALLSQTAEGQKNSDLEYLLHERRARWAYTDHGTRLGQTMKAAMSGHDATSQHLFKETSELLGRDTRRYFTYDKDHHLKFTNTDGHADDLSGLRPSLGDILCSHLKDVAGALFGDVIGGGAPRGHPSPRDIDALLAEAGQNDDAFTALVKSGIGRARVQLDQQYSGGQGVDAVLIAQGGLLGHLLAMRREVLIARGATVDTANQQVKELIGKGIGLVPVPYAKLFSGVPASLYKELADNQYGKVGDWLFSQTRQDGGSADEDAAAATDEQAVRRLLRQMSLSAAIDHFNDSGGRALGEPFADEKGHILPWDRWADDSRAQSRFIDWCEENNFAAPRMSQTLETVISNSHDDAVNSFNGAGKTP
ncbi:hypothetical protein [Actinomadura sp. DC4]|uniref:hypothetical protein n=1 Tax=Actinomadura sp. DC4 TaxID=3055069 RepID=UPI0025B0F27A|nr:hypothetical protein [Actinomadura sp. DC4]MDN3352635.1 hypothetical protein [Actinomadura sp. DC4]